MARKRKYTKEVVEELVRRSDSIRSVVMNANGNHTGGSQALFSKYIREYEIDISHFYKDQSSKFGGGLNKLTLEQIFIKGVRPRRTKLLRALKESGIEYICSLCGQLPIWNNKELILEIDHIDGDNTNQLKDNLRFLCPHCHSQTETYGRNKDR